MVSKLVSFDSQWYPLTPSLGDLGDPNEAFGLVPVLGKVIVSLLVCGGIGGGKSEERLKLNLSSNLSWISWVLLLVLAYTMSSDLGSMLVAILGLNKVSLFNLSLMSVLIIDIWMNKKS